MILNEIYDLNHSGFIIKYKPHYNEQYTPGDYIQLEKFAIVNFHLKWTKSRLIDCSTDVYFNTGRSFKFIDMCNNYFVRFILREDTIIMQFLDKNLFTFFNSVDVIYEITLQRRTRRA